MSEHICPYCGVGVESHEEPVACPACAIVFHKECWFQNQGCATYGCKHVGCLKPPPEKLEVSSPPSMYRPGAIYQYNETKSKGNFLDETPVWQFAVLGFCTLSFVPSVFFGLWWLQLLFLLLLLGMSIASEKKPIILVCCLVAVWTFLVSGCFAL